MQKRKFDHDQVNNLLVRTLNPVQSVLAKDYEPGIAAADWLLGDLDERVSEAALRHYRERVWWDALAYAARADRRGRELIVRNKLEWQSYRLAKRLSRPALDVADRARAQLRRASRCAGRPVERRSRSSSRCQQARPRRSVERPVGEIGRSPTPA